MSPSELPSWCFRRRLDNVLTTLRMPRRFARENFTSGRRRRRCLRSLISQDTRVKKKVISASFAYLNLVESKLNCQNRDYLPLGILLRVLMTIVWYHGEFTDRIFYWSPTWTKTSEFEQSVEVRTDVKSESGIVEGFPSMNISPGRDPYTVFTSFLVSRLVSSYYPVLTDACILPR